MLAPVPPSDCTRARECASARLDGELTELEAAYLDAHIEGCAECRFFAAELGAMAARLRQTPLEQPAGAMFAPPIRRRVGFASAAATVAVVAIAAGASLGIGGLLGIQGARSNHPATTTVQARLGPIDQVMLAMLRGEPPTSPMPKGRSIAV